MIVDQTHIRVRYSETDKMGYVYYGQYLTYFEIARAELVRRLGVPYSEMEENYGFFLPVVEAHVEYKAPAKYDDLLVVRTFLKTKPGVKIRFDHEVERADGTPVAVGYTILAFLKAPERRPARPPLYFLQAVDRYWNDASDIRGL
ncbi:MAG: thioesterase family protein [Bacteroidia bacterium]|nr:acyl-CoA thioesterase [Bacteroidia bacterium]MDW8333722.1 thioesterase family protein [Bacteroidia bacterium]